MPRQSKAELQALWETRIGRSLHKRKSDFEDPFRVKMAREYLEGKQRPPEIPHDEWISINKIYSHMQAQLPILYSLDPYYHVNVKKSYNPNPVTIALFEARAEGRQDYLNYLKAELKLKDSARLAIQDAHTSYGVVKVHHSSDEYENPDRGKPMLGESGEPLRDSEGNEILEPDVIPINERYSVTRIHPDDLVWSEDAGTLEDKWHWIAERVRMTPEEAKKRKLINKDVLAETGTQAPDEPDEQPRSGVLGGMLRGWRKPKADNQEGKEDREVYIGWEVYDLDHKQWMLILEGAKRPAIDPQPLPDGIESHPYAILRFTLRDDSPYPLPPLSQALDPQREYNDARSKILVHRKRFNRKYEAFVGGLEDEIELDKLEEGEDGTIIRKNNPNPVVTAIQDAPLDQQGWIETNALNNDITEMLGSPGEARGLSEADSATQAALIDKRLDIREGDRVALVSDWLGLIGRKLDQIIQANITQDEAIKILGPEGEQVWRLIRQDDYLDIEGEFEYTVDVGSTQPRLPQIERAQWLAFLQVLGGFPHLLTSQRLMKHMAELHNISDDTMVEELRQIGLKIMSGQMPMPGQKGAQSGQETNNPITAALGAAFGDQGGITNGGGAESLSQA